MQLSITQHFPELLKMSGQAGVLILLVLAVQWLFARRLRPRWRYALWLLVMVRLALPLTVSSSASLFNLLNLAPRLPLLWPPSGNSTSARIPRGPRLPPARPRNKTPEAPGPKRKGRRQTRAFVGCLACGPPASWRSEFP